MSVRSRMSLAARDYIKDASATRGDKLSAACRSGASARTVGESANPFPAISRHVFAADPAGRSAFRADDGPLGSYPACHLDASVPRTEACFLS